MSDTVQHPRRGRRRWKSHKHGPLFSSIWFTLHGLNWVTLIILCLIFLRPHPLVANDYLVGGIGIGLGFFYIFVAYAVFMRRKYILNVAFACAGFGLLGIPFGTFISILLLANLVSTKHDFTK